MTIADELDSAMKAFNGHKGISQAELAKKSGVPQPTISRTLKGVSQPETATLRKLAKFLGATIGGVSGDPAPPELCNTGEGHGFPMPRGTLSGSSPRRTSNHRTKSVKRGAVCSPWACPRPCERIPIDQGKSAEIISISDFRASARVSFADIPNK